MTFSEESITLQQWTVNATSFQPCENVYFTSWWSSATVPQHNYGTTLVLVAPDGRNVAQKDTTVADIPMQLWEANHPYFDERVLTVPCDAAPGEYQLKMGMYRGIEGGFVDLTAFTTDGEEQGVRGFLTGIQVEAKGD